MSTNNLIITESKVQATQSIAMTLLAMTYSHDLPESVRLVIEDLNDSTESLLSHSHINKANGLKVVSNG